MALSRHHAALSTPRSVEDLVQEAQQFEFNTNRPLQQWLRAAKMLLTEASICEQEGNLATAYLYLYRHADLILSKLPEHPDYRDPRYKLELSQARKTVQRNLVKLEQWKPRITQDYQRYAKAMDRRSAERQRAQQEFDQAARRLSYDPSRRTSIASMSSRPPSPISSLSAMDNRELAVNLAQRELRRRDASRKSTTEAGIPAATVAERRRGLVAPDYGDYAGARGPPQGHDDGVRAVGQQLQQQSLRSRNGSNGEQSMSSTFHYPSVPQKESRMEWNTPPIQPSIPQSRYTMPIPPARPAKESLHKHSASGLPRRQPPPRPPRPDSLETPGPPPSPPQVPSKYTFKPTAFTEAGAPLRTVLLPPDLRTQFLNLADPNTSRNLETCGILAGTIIANALFINTLIIPDQTSTSDTCDTTDQGEIDLFSYCDSNDLLVMGWIHTHPSQSCFLSSRDLHTSSGYQVMLPEAIAIVCAPRHNPDWGIFRLTDPPGLPHVLECRKPGIFHTHDEDRLYTDALRPGHVVEGPGLQFEVVDLRKGKMKVTS
ncbi:hypothetical protein CKM354_000171200 [Cercospora kikuchii]|uniref:MPN domain-containing protein n=1 Tax=Cercospora kikuchii TaxID=84275 RepID=A0A9P3C7U3_9PEZI|nr:uncharacterized protein CKM354_000171200 [Cercospora kikuchii]GIZ38292.1 hypothetical protein CKM354_000171200 [Cercospora kikuchii]